MRSDFTNCRLRDLPCGRRLMDRARFVHKKSPAGNDNSARRNNNRSEFKRMDLAAAGLMEQPFHTQGTPDSIVSYASHLEGLEAIRAACETRNGLALLQGPPLSGKSTLIRHLVNTIDDDQECAVVDGTGLNTSTLLEATLQQFPYRQRTPRDDPGLRVAAGCETPATVAHHRKHPSAQSQRPARALQPGGIEVPET